MKTFFLYDSPFDESISKYVTEQWKQISDEQWTNILHENYHKIYPDIFLC